MNPRQDKFEVFISSVGERAGELLKKIPAQGGRLRGDQARELGRELELGQDELMMALLPLARLFAVTPVSGFQVGAVALAGIESESDYGIFIGANYEFSGQALNQSIHAEQAAAMNAWRRGARDLKAVAVSATPCGHCRQFMSEFGADAGSIKIITPGDTPESFSATNLAELLPRAFGPQDLDNPESLATVYPPGGGHGLWLNPSDSLADQALAAADGSYAPYTGNFAGCAIRLQSGEEFRGSYVENAAFNPSLTPLHTSVIGMNMTLLEEDPVIERAVLVERTTTISQKQTIESLLNTWAPQVALEYHRADIRTEP